MKKVSELVVICAIPFYKGVRFVKYLVDNLGYWSFVKDELVSDNFYQEILFVINEFVLIKTTDDKMVILDHEENLLLLEDTEGNPVPAIFDNFFRRSAETLLVEKEKKFAVVNIQKKTIFIDPFEEGEIKNNNFHFSKEINFSCIERKGEVLVISSKGEIKKYKKDEKREILVSF